MRKFGTLCAFSCAVLFASAGRLAAVDNPVANLFPDMRTAPMSEDPAKLESDRLDGAQLVAEEALKSGLPSLAQTIMEDVLLNFKLQPGTEEALREIYIDSLIAQGNFELANKQFAFLGAAANTAKNRIRHALAYIGLGQPYNAEEMLAGIDENTVSPQDAAWYHLAKGYVYFEASNPADALKEFDKAKESANSEYSIADIDIAINICRLSGDMGIDELEKMEKSLAEKVIIYLGTPAGFQFAKQYAAVLFKQGKAEQALEVINQQLDIELAQDVDKDELRLISAAMMVDNPERQYSLLRDILRQTTSIGVADYALALISRNRNSTPESLTAFLSEILDSGSIRIRDRILLELAKVAIRANKRDEGAALATKLMDEFPASVYRDDALRILAWAAFSSDTGKTPEYRLAASYLLQLANLEENAKRAAKTRMLAADCYFLNKDYANAAKIYSELFSSGSDNKGVLLNRAVEAYLKMDDIAEAIKLLETAYAQKSVKDDDLWNAEWKIISSYRDNGEIAKALARIDGAIENSHNVSGSVALRMLWLKARISEEAHKFPETIQLCDEILARASADKERPIFAIIGSNAMLMKARCLEEEGKEDGETGAFETYAQLRKDYPQSEAAQLSYLYQARALAKLGRYSQAQQMCNMLADLFPDGEYAYTALFDSAEYARQTGTRENYLAALATLDRLYENFPNNEQNFYARLSQAAILRLLNSFGDARALYNDIINKYPSHKEIYLAWMGLGNSTLAQQGRYLDAAAIFERLYSLPDIPAAAKAEAAFMWAFALNRADRTREANEVLWGTSLRFLEGGELDGAARYWVGRSLFTLANSLKSLGQMRDARAAYEIIVKNKLPSYQTAERNLNILPKN